MAGVDPGGLADGTRVAGWVRSDEQGDYIPCGCGQAVQRPTPGATATVDAARIFVCQREGCDRRTVQERPTTEADR